MEKDGPLKTLQKKEYDGRTVFGIVSRAIRPRRCGCHRDYLRVCRQRRVEFGASSSLELFFFGCSCFCCSALCVRVRGISLVSLEFYTFLSFLSLVSETDSGKCVHSSLVLSFLRTGETIAEIGKEALKTIDWSTQTPTR